LPILFAPTLPSAAQEEEPPNILVIVTDDQRGGISVMPAVQHYFSKRGVAYKPGFVTTPVCCPSRASIMTGRYAHNHGVKSNSNTEEPGSTVLDHSTTMQAYLQEDGYHTGMIGKFLNPPWELDNNPPYFDEWVTFGGVQQSPDSNTWFDSTYNVNGTLKEISGYTTSILRRRSKGFLRRNAPSDDPWFLYVGTKAPHLPASPQPRYADEPIESWDGNPAVFEEDKTDKPAYVQSADRDLRAGRGVRKRQYRSLMSVDDMVGALFDELRETGDLKDTLIFFISDNGYAWAEHGLTGKGIPYRQSVTVPFFARWPDHLPRGVTDDRFAANIDIAPTVLDAADITPDVPQDGKSLLQNWQRPRIHLESWCNAQGLPCNRWASTWDRSFQYTEYYESGSVAFREYYDLEADPWQLTNLLEDGDEDNDPNLVPLKVELDNDHSCVAATCP
jgi:arylsulfatase A-like enzyme